MSRKAKKYLQGETKMKKRILSAILVSSLVLSMAGCNGDTPASEPVSQQSQTSTSTSEAAFSESTSSSSSSLSIPSDTISSNPVSSTIQSSSSTSKFPEETVVKVGQYNMYAKGTTYYDGYVYYGNGNLCRRSVEKNGLGNEEILVRDEYIYKVLFVIDDEVYFSRIYQRDPRALMKCNIDGSNVVTIMENYDCQYWTNDKQEIYGLLQWVSKSPETGSDGKIITKYTAKAQIIKIDRKNNTWDSLLNLENNVYYYFHGNVNNNIYFEKKDIKKASTDIYYHDWGNNLGLFELNMSSKNEKLIVNFHADMPSTSYWDLDFLGATNLNDEIFFIYTKENGQNNELHKVSLDGTDTIIITTPNKFGYNSLEFSSIDMSNPCDEFFFYNNRVYAQFEDDSNLKYLYDVTDGTMNYVCNVNGEWGFYNPFSNSICYIPYR